jgi:hypothetical protein
VPINPSTTMKAMKKRNARGVSPNKASSIDGPPSQRRTEDARLG